MSNQEVRGVLEKAAKYVSQGWCQGQYAVYAPIAAEVELLDPDEPWLKVEKVCLVGAIGTALHDVVKAEHTAEHKAHVMGAAVDAVSSYLDSPSGLAAWNDDPDRLAIEVEDALRDTALSLESEGK